VPGELHGSNGQQLPGSPKVSLNAALNYSRRLVQDYDLLLSLNGSYRSSETMSLAPVLGSTTVQQNSSYEVVNLSATVNHKPWRYTAYVTNVLNRESVLVPPPQAAAGQNFYGLADDSLVNPPRVIGIRVGYTF
jgi:hypothetical protein